MLTRYNGQLKLKEWAIAIARRSSMRKARIALARRLAIIMHAMLRDGTEFVAAQAQASTPEEPPALTIRERYSQILVIARGRAEWVKSTLSGHQRSALCGLSPEVPLNPRRRRRTGRETRRPKFIAATSAQTTTSKATAATTPGANATVDARRHMRRKGRKEVKPSCLPAFGQERCDHSSDGFGLFLVEAERSSDPLHAHLSAGWDCGHFSF